MIGFDALPEALASIQGGELSASIEQFPGEQSRTALRLLVDYLRDGKQPENALLLLTPVAITEGNFDQAERLERAEVVLRPSRPAPALAVPAGPRAPPLRAPPMTEPLLRVSGIAKRYPAFRPWTGSRSTCGRARSTASSARTAPASRRCSRSCPAPSGPMPAGSRSAASGGCWRARRTPRRTASPTIYQELNLLPNLSVAENVFIGREPGGRAFLSWRRLVEATRDGPGADRPRRSTRSTLVSATLGRRAADGRDRPRALDRSARDHHGRADLGAVRGRGRAPVRDRPRAARRRGSASSSSPIAWTR